jgi:hypothetical protein
VKPTRNTPGSDPGVFLFVWLARRRWGVLLARCERGVPGALVNPWRGGRSLAWLRRLGSLRGWRWLVRKLHVHAVLRETLLEVGWGSH